MINDIQRKQFLENPQQFAHAPCLAIAVVGDDSAEETVVLESWAFLKERLNGAGTRVGYRAFLALIRDSETDLRSVVDKFLLQEPAHASWRFVAAPIGEPKDSLSVLQEVEWRAHKANQPLKILGAPGAL